MFADKLVHYLWRGEMPLARAFWGLGVLAAVLFNTAYMVIEAHSIDLAIRGIHRPLMITLLIVQYIYTPLVFVAIWRSAGRYPGRRSWAWLARLAVVGWAALLLWMTVGYLLPDTL